MHTSLLSRIRWGNVVLAVLLLALVVAIVGWPALRSPDPQLPPSDPVPIAATPEEESAEEAPAPKPRARSERPETMPPKRSVRARRPKGHVSPPARRAIAQARPAPRLQPPAEFTFEH